MYIYSDIYIYIYTSVNPCIKCMEFSVTQVGVSEFSETLTGGSTTSNSSNFQLVAALNSGKSSTLHLFRCGVLWLEITTRN